MVISFVIYGLVIRCPQTHHKCNLVPVQYCAGANNYNQILRRLCQQQATVRMWVNKFIKIRIGVLRIKVSVC